MKSFDEILEYLNNHHYKVDYQVYPDKPDESIEVQLDQDISLFIDVKRYQIALDLDSWSPLPIGETAQFLQQLQQAMELGESLKKFLQSP